MMNSFNNIDIKNFNAQISKKYIQPSTLDNKVEWKDGALLPSFIKSDIKFKNIEIKILFENESRDLILNDISNFMAIGLDECEIKFDNLSNYFKCYVSDSNIEDTEFDEWLYLNLSFLGYEHSEEKTKTFTEVSSFYINNNGNTKTPCILEIMPSTNIIELTIAGLTEEMITINNLEMNKKVIINSEDGTVTCEGDNKFNDCSMWEFPCLKAGFNNITLNSSNLTIKIIYKERMI